MRLLITCCRFNQREREREKEREAIEQRAEWDGVKAMQLQPDEEVE